MTALRKPAAERFRAMVERTDSCWNWLGAKSPEGYGRFGAGEGRAVLAHRWAYERHVGPIPDDLTIDHLCRNTSCVNPAHMEVVTRELNAWRGSTNKDKTHCKRGHALAGLNVYVPPKRPTVRACRTCRKATSAAQYRRTEGRAA